MPPINGACFFSSGSFQITCEGYEQRPPQSSSKRGDLKVAVHTVNEATKHRFIHDDEVNANREVRPDTLVARKWNYNLGSKSAELSIPDAELMRGRDAGRDRPE